MSTWCGRHEEDGSDALSLRIAEVEVGMRGAVRRLLKGLPATADRIASRFSPASFRGTSWT